MFTEGAGAGGGALDVGEPLHGVEFEAEMLLKKRNVGAVDEEVCAEFEEARLLFDAAPEVNPRANAGRARFAEDGSHALEESGWSYCSGKPRLHERSCGPMSTASRPGTARISSSAAMRERFRCSR